MKVTCEFCGNIFNDTLEKCPNCGAPSSGVKRSSDKQPTTIEELKAWYAEKGLPPAEVTRFFIGEDYKQPRAFGIYKDSSTGNFVVYKNKDTGDRAVRYEGTDEAYAVNELFQRLKQEIIQQKANNLKKNTNGLSGKVKSGIFGALLGGVSWIAHMVVFGIMTIAFGLVSLIAVGIFVILTEPKTGYYNYDHTYYYYSSPTYADINWYYYDTDSDDWLGIPSEYIPSEFSKKRTAKPFFVEKKWDERLGCPDFGNSIFINDIDKGDFVDTGYYKVEDYYFYHYDSDIDGRWYIYNPDDDWEKIDFYDLPYELQHSSIVANSFASADYIAGYVATDFYDSVVYQDIQAGNTILKGYYLVDDAVFYHLADDYEEGWYTYSDDDWTAIDNDSLPADLTHPSYMEDFYYTPDWNSDTQFSDFTDTALYDSDKDNWNDNDNSSDSGSDSYDWGGSDSWDSGGSDWSSDW